MKTKIKEMLMSPDLEIRLLGLAYLNQEKIYSAVQVCSHWCCRNWNWYSCYTVTQSIQFGLPIWKIIDIDPYLNYCYEEKNC